MSAQDGNRPDIAAFFHEDTSTLSYVVADPATGHCAIVDPVLDYDAAAGRTADRSAQAIAAFVRERDYRVAWVLETHVHADHLSAGAMLAGTFGAPLAIGARISEVQETFAGIYNLPDFPCDGSQFGHLFADGDTFSVGGIEARVLHTPGHTPACLTYVIGDAAFVGDTLFMPDGGTARCDFPGGSAATLYRSIQKIFALPDETRLFVCHDYRPGGRDLAWQTTVGEQKAANIHVGGGTGCDAFVELREERDATLGMPRLILPSIQVNMRGGRLPPADANGTAYLRIPLNRL